MLPKWTITPWYVVSKSTDLALNRQHFIIGCAWMFLFDVVAFNAENTASLKVARRLTQTIRAMKMNVMGLGGDLDVFIAMT
jgi:hypothetical protein